MMSLYKIRHYESSSLHTFSLLSVELKWGQPKMGSRPLDAFGAATVLRGFGDTILRPTPTAGTVR